MSIAGFLLPMLASAALSIPEPDGPFIRDLGPADGSGNLVVELLVAPDHTVQDCRVLSPAPDAGAKRVCEQERHMKVRTVARDLDRNPIYGFVTVARIARLASASRRASRDNLDPFSYYPADVQVGVVDLPGRDQRKRVFVTVLIDGEGALKHCESGDPSSGELGVIACREAAHYSYPKISDPAGIAQTYTRLLNVEFVEQPVSAATR